jgi:hypothetical protein
MRVPVTLNCSVGARVMIAAVTRAVQQKTREMELGRSVSESLRKTFVSGRLEPARWPNRRPLASRPRPSTSGIFQIFREVGFALVS